MSSTGLWYNRIVNIVQNLVECTQNGQTTESLALLRIGASATLSDTDFSPLQAYTIPHSLTHKIFAAMRIGHES